MGYSPRGRRVGHDCATELNWWLSGQESACHAGDTGESGLIPGWGKSPGGGNGYPLQYSCLENPIDRGAWRATVHGVKKSRTRLSMHTQNVYLKTVKASKLYVTCILPSPPPTP